MKTDLHVKDCAFVGIAGGLTTWIGETINVLVIGLTKKDFSYSEQFNKSVTKPHEIHIFLEQDWEEYRKFARDNNGIECISFITPKIRGYLRHKEK